MLAKETPAVKAARARYDSATYDVRVIAKIYNEAKKTLQDANIEQERALRELQNEIKKMGN